MIERKLGKRKIFLGCLIFLMLGVGVACQLTSPRPASWAGTPTAEARNTEIALTQAAIASANTFVFTPTLPTRTPITTPSTTVTTTFPDNQQEGPWFIFPRPEGEGLIAYNLNSRKADVISLPEPIIIADLKRGAAPDGSKLMLRAGSAHNTDELALYQIDLPSFEVSQITPLLSIKVQRKIVNNEGTRAQETLSIVTRPDGLAWSPNGRYLAFSAALHQENSDLYVFDAINNRIERLNGLYSQNASPAWSPGGDWLISQELEYNRQHEIWHSELISGIHLPQFDHQNTLYLPPTTSIEEVFVGWLNSNAFLSYSITENGSEMLRQVNVEGLKNFLIFEGLFQQVAIDPNTGITAFNLNFSTAINQGLSGGVYRIEPDSPLKNLQAEGDWKHLTWDPGGMFVASGSQGVLLFTPQGESKLLPGERDARLSPNGNWFIAWGDGKNSTSGARLFQSHSINPLQTLIDKPVETLIWQPDSKGFLILSEGTLYHFIFPGLKPEEIITGLPVESDFIWAWVD
jgi:hypothetical protein